jgi:hypothetical protein
MKLVEFVPVPTRGVDDAWIRAVGEKVRGDIAKVQSKVDEVRAEVGLKRESVVGKAKALRASFAHHRQLMHVVKPMLRAMSKVVVAQDLVYYPVMSYIRPVPTC